MANERISMREIRDIIRLREKGLGYRQIADELIGHLVDAEWEVLPSRLLRVSILLSSRTRRSRARPFSSSWRAWSGLRPWSSASIPRKRTNGLKST